MSNIIYGYIRVSSRDQNEDRQRIAMREAGVDYVYQSVYEITYNCLIRLLDVQ